MSGELAGALRERVTLLRRGDDRDELGGADGAWVQLGTVWAAISPERTGRLAEADAVSALADWRLVLRAPSAARVDDRVTWGERTLRIRAIVADPRQPDRITINAEEER